MLRRLESEFETLRSSLNLIGMEFQECHTDNLWEKVRVLEVNICRIKMSVAYDLYAWNGIKG